MNWSDERYVRLYTRDSVTWKGWTWEARALFGLLIRKVDRSGVLDTGKGDKARALALMLETPTEVAARALAEWVECGTAVLTPTSLVLPSFVEAQEAAQSDKTRQKESRERRKAAALATVEKHEVACHELSQHVTARHSTSHGVTPAVPYRAVPAVPEEVVAPLRVASPVVDELVEAWNSLPHPPFPACHAVTGKRLRAAQARLREVPDIGRWRRAVARLPASPFLRGENDRGWVATLDWLLKPDTLTKLEEGAYDARGSPRGPTLVTPGEGAIQATIGEML